MMRASAPILLLASALATSFGWNGSSAPLDSSAILRQAAVESSSSPHLAVSVFGEVAVAESAPNGVEWGGAGGKRSVLLPAAATGSAIPANGLSTASPAGIPSSAVLARRHHPSTAPPRRN